jgi:hypothetical protein
LVSDVQAYLDNYETKKEEQIMELKTMIADTATNGTVEDLVMLTKELGTLVSAPKPELNHFISRLSRVILFEDKAYSIQMGSSLGKPINTTGTVSKNKYPYPFQIGDSIYQQANSCPAGTTYKITDRGLLDEVTGQFIRPSIAVLEYRKEYCGFVPDTTFKGFAGLSHPDWKKLQ